MIKLGTWYSVCHSNCFDPTDEVARVSLLSPSTDSSNGTSKLERRALIRCPESYNPLNDPNIPTIPIGDMVLLSLEAGRPVTNAQESCMYDASAGQGATVFIVGTGAQLDNPVGQ